MCWSRATARDFNLERHSTSERIGPGTYNLDNPQSPKSARSPSACFLNNNNRDIFTITSIVTPSPGDYDQNVTSSKLACTNSFKSRTKRDVYKVSKDLPGPAEYSDLANWSPPKKSQQTKAVNYYHVKQVSGNVGQDVLGYQLNEDGRTVTAVKKLFHGPDYVGPGSYSPKSQSSSRIHSLNECYRGNHDLWDQNTYENPGPGKYRPDNPDQRYMRKISQKPDNDMIDAPKSEGISPTEWGPKGKTSQNSIFKSKSERKIYDTPENTPSPVAYQRERRRNTESASMANAAFGQRSARFDEQRIDGPGPGQYESKSMQWGKSGGSMLCNRAVERTQPAGNDVPGPGTYNPKNSAIKKKDHRPNSVFSSRSKKGWEDTTCAPGPGAYNISKKEKIPKKTIHASRFKETNNFMFNPYQNNPSPVEYQQIETPRKRGKSISRSDRFEYKQNDNPGPGSYEIVHSSLIKKSSHIDFRGVS